MDRNYAGVHVAGADVAGADVQHRPMPSYKRVTLSNLPLTLPTPAMPITGDPSGMSGCQRGTFFTVAIGPG